MPLCAADAPSLYMIRLTDRAPDAATLEQVNVAQGSISTIWSNETAAPPAPLSAPPADGASGASVAIGTNPQDGYLYAIRAHNGDGDAGNPSIPVQMLKFGQSGVDNLDEIQGIPAAYRGYPNFNAADFAPTAPCTPPNSRINRAAEIWAHWSRSRLPERPQTRLLNTWVNCHSPASFPATIRADSPVTSP